MLTDLIECFRRIEIGKNIPFGVRTGSAVNAGLILICTSLGATNDDCWVKVRVLFELLEY